MKCLWKILAALLGALVVVLAVFRKGAIASGEFLKSELKKENEKTKARQQVFEKELASIDEKYKDSNEKTESMLERLHAKWVENAKNKS